tara:strand:- start:2414 stop:3262 length:849 start_codon:yes stop_codon:yes gene_type:complete
MTIQKIINVGDIKISNENSFTLIGGVNVIENEIMAFKVAESFKTVTEKLNIPFIFKASFDKANRSSIDSFRGPGLEKGLSILKKIKSELDIPILTDIHEPLQAKPVSKIANVIQLPAFLSRQTDLVFALAKTKSVINIKKAQFLSPNEMLNIIKKFESVGNNRLIICERGSCFGYNNLVVDMLGFSIMKKFGYPILFDVTHSLQVPGGLGYASAGRRESISELAIGGLSQKIAGLFIEAHPEPENALCDGQCALKIQKLEPFLKQMKAIDDLVKSFDNIDTS